MTRESSRSAIWPWPTPTRASGTRRESHSAIRKMLLTRLCTKKTCPPRASSRRTASATSAGSKRAIVVWMASRFSGGVATSESSRSPESARCSVRGIGVAVSVSTSTCARIRLSASLWRTPKRCSSSMISRPRSGKTMSFPTMRCVPIRMSTSPFASAATTRRCSFGVTNRLRTSIRVGHGAKRSRKVTKCCWASTVVGASSATCLPSITALKAARIATSVLP